MSASSCFRRGALGAAILAALPAAPLLAQNARIVGRVLSVETGAPVVGAVVELVGSGQAATTGTDGRYTLQGVAAGLASLRARMIGYQAKTVSEIRVPAEGALALDITLSAQVFQIEELHVTAAAERGSVVRALEDQRISNSIINSVTSEQIRKSPDSDAGQAVQRVSGVTVQDGRYVVVRGLGERYTTTSLNGARIPSPEPEKKTVPFDLFPAGLLAGITTSKTFTPDQAGDFSGAHVDLRTREFPATRVFNLSVSAGFNTDAFGSDVVKAPRVGNEWLGFAGAERRIPADAAAAGDLGGLSQPQVNGIIASFRDSWQSYQASGAPNGGIGLSVGGEDPLFGQLVGYTGSVTYSYGQEVRLDEERALVTSGGPINEYTGETGRMSVLWGGLLNLSTRIGGATKITSANTYTRSADNEAARLHGINEQFSQFGLLEITRLTFTERSVLSNQLRGDHVLGPRHQVFWQASRARTRRYEPDRSDLVYQVTQNGNQFTPTAWADVPQGASRTFSDLTETAWEGAGDYRMLLGNLGSPVSLKVGGVYRHTDRDAHSRQYDIHNLGLTDQELHQTPDVLFGDANAQAGKLFLQANSNVGSYTAREVIGAGYVQLEAPLSGRLRVVGGARVENWNLEVVGTTTSGITTPSNPTATDVLPSIAFTYALSGSQQLRLSASRTLARPEYREVAAVNSFDILGGLQMFGNPDLKRSLVDNFDARWEWYPRSGETVSLALFAKRFHDPIERIQVATTGANALSFVNAEAGQNYGVELEVRRNLDLIAPAFSSLTVFGNATLMQSTIEPGNDSISALTNASRPMVGQSAYVVNAGLSWTQPGSELAATLLYNVQGRRIVDAGVEPLPDGYEEARHLLDVSVQVPVFHNMTLKLDGKNLLDSPYRITQGDATRLRYRTGRVFGLSASIGL